MFAPVRIRTFVKGGRILFIRIPLDGALKRMSVNVGSGQGPRPRSESIFFFLKNAV